MRAATAPFSPGIQALIPLLYIAWADRVLSPSEVRFLRRKAQTLGLAPEEDRALLERWSNPARPPSRELFKQWEIEVKTAAARLSKEARQSLAELCLEMARRGASGHEQTRWNAPETKTALQELIDAMGLKSAETYRQLFVEPAPVELPSVSFDIAALQALLRGPYAEIRRRTLNLLKDPVFRYREWPRKEDYREQVLGWCRLLANRGLGGLAFPRAHGGQDDMGAYAMVFETLGYHDLSLAVKFGVQFGLFGGSIHALGTEEHRERYLPKVATLELPGCFAMTETAHGSNVRGLETTITYDAPAAEFVVHTPREAAGKEYIGNALHGRMAAVFGQLIVGGENRGVHAILTPLRDELGRLLPGIRVEDNGYKMGLNGVDNGRIWFDEVRVPREHLLSRFGGVGPDGEYASPIKDPSRRFFTMLGALVGGRVCVPRAGLSAAKSALSIAVRYGLRRRQFGPSYTEPETIIMDYPAHQRRLLPPLAKAYALHFALEGLSERYLRRRPEEMREIETLAAGMKAYTTWFVTATIQECREACGGKGYLAENRFAALKADTDIFTTFEGDNTVLMQLVARGVLSDFRKEFAEEGVWGMLRYLGANFATNILERNPIVIRLTDREHLLGREFHLNAFQYRERRLLSSAAQRLRALIKDGMTAYDAFLRCQTHLLALAEAFVERFVLEKFHEAIGANENEELSPILEKLCQFFALHTIEKNQGWYLGKDYIRANKSRAIRRLIDDLCAEIRPDAGALVEAFDIPRELLGAPIAFEE